MRVRIIFSLQNKGGLVPFHHQHLLAQFLRGLMSENAEKKYQGYHFYSFSGLKGQIKVTPNGLCFLSNKVTLVFSCPDEVFIKSLLLRLFDKALVEIGQLKLVPDAVLYEETPPLMAEQKYVCISPVVLQTQGQDTDESKRFLNPNEDLFSDLLYESTMSRMEQSGFYTSEQIASFYKFQIIPDKQYLDKMRVEEKKFARIYTAYANQQKIELRGYIMPFLLMADPEVQRFIFDCGFGEATNLGFGMIDVANMAFGGRVREYQFRENSVSQSA